ncbi:12640_t:CDS:2, partial [Funneliformis geosporum]
FDIAFEGIYSLCDIKMAVKSLSDKEIKDNMRDLKKKLARNTTSHSEELCQKLKNIFVSDFSWKDVLANQVISDNSDLVKNLGKSAYQSFMKLIQNMQLIMPEIIQE